MHYASQHLYILASYVLLLRTLKPNAMHSFFTNIYRLLVYSKAAGYLDEGALEAVGIRSILVPPRRENKNIASGCDMGSRVD